SRRTPPPPIRSLTYMFSSVGGRKEQQPSGDPPLPQPTSPEGLARTLEGRFAGPPDIPVAPRRRRGLGRTNERSGPAIGFEPAGGRAPARGAWPEHHRRTFRPRDRPHRP